LKEFLFGWVQDIAFYTLLMVVVLHVLPGKSQRKYLQFFMGVILIILVISPVLKFTGLERKLDTAYAFQTYDQELQEFRRRQTEIEEQLQGRLERQLKETQEQMRLEEEEAIEYGTFGTGTGIGIEEIRIRIEEMEKD